MRIEAAVNDDLGNQNDTADAWTHSERNVFIKLEELLSEHAQSSGAVEYTNCISAEG